MVHNEIYIHTDRGEYVGGDTVYGTIFLAIHHPVNAKKLYLEIRYVNAFDIEIINIQTVAYYRNNNHAYPIYSIIEPQLTLLFVCVVDMKRLNGKSKGLNSTKRAGNKEQEP
jgi:hypothetical protein